LIPYNTEVEIIRAASGGGEDRRRAKAMINRNELYFPIDTDVEEGDHIEYMEGTKLRALVLTKIDYLRSAFGSDQLDHIEAQYTVGRVRSAAPVGPVTISGMHPHISAAAAALFADGHREQAVFAAFRAVEARVQFLTGRSETGQGLMSSIFSGSSPQLDITKARGRSGQDERDGFRFLFMGAIAGLRNPRGHGTVMQDTPDEALEYLALASMLMRRLDVAADRQTPSSPAS
jgi:uncharacterized protein (TIGR02391 family)